MRDVTEQLLLAKSGDVVTDGLLVWVDGRDAPLQNYALLNRVTGTSIQAYSGNIAPWSVTQTENALYIHVFGNSSANNDFWIGQNMNLSAQTIEVVLNNGSDSSVFGLDEYRPRLKYMYTYKKLRYWYDYDNFGNINTADTALHIVGRPGVITVNGQNYTTVSGFDSVAFKSLIICRGALGDKNFCYGALRAYNRILSDAEVLQNYKYEQSIGRAAE